MKKASSILSMGSKGVLDKTRQQYVQYLIDSTSLYQTLYPHQQEIWDYFFPKDLPKIFKQQSIAVWSRRAGKDYVCLLIMLRKALENPGSHHAYYLDNRPQAVNVIWKGVLGNNKPFLSLIPDFLITRKNETRLEIELYNGSIIRFLGAENYNNTIRGANYLGIIASEFAHYPKPKEFYEALVPILAPKNKSYYLILQSTPYGQNHFYDLFIKTDVKKWFKIKKPASECLDHDGERIITQELIDSLVGGEMSEAAIEREYNCSFDASLDDVYYAEAMEAVEREGRILPLYYKINEFGPVNISWDIGIIDPTILLFWQMRGDFIYFIDFYQNNLKEIDFYLKYIIKQRILKHYRYGYQIFPHDIIKKSTRHSSESRWSIVNKIIRNNNLGKAIMGPMYLIDDGIHITLTNLKQCYFNSKTCMPVITALKHYSQGKSGKPIHDQYSHIADAVRLTMVENTRTDFRNTETNSTGKIPLSFTTDDKY